MESDYIERSNIYKRFRNAPSTLTDYQALWNAVKNEPSADVEPVRHGHWAPYGPSFAPWQCSECKYDTGLKENYCPNCGAKMDGKEEKNEL